MNKLFTKIVGAALGATMAIGVGVAVASNRQEIQSANATTVTGEFTKYTSSIVEGDYVFYVSYTANKNPYTQAMKNTVSSTKITSQSLTLSSGKVVNPDDSIVWHIAPSGNYWTIRNVNNSKYVVATGAAGKADLADSAGDKGLFSFSFASSLWTITSKYNSDEGVNAKFCANRAATNYWACYAAGSSGVELYKKASIPVTGVSLNKSSTGILVGNTETLTATVAPNNATNKNVTWKSYSDSTCTTESSAVASVSSSGVVTANSAGTAYIQVKTVDGNFTAKCTVTVTSSVVPVTGVSLNKNSTTIEVLKTETLTATVSPADATNKNVTWKSYSDSTCTTESSAVASVSSSGVVTANSAGTAYIQVKTVDGNFTAKCTINVTKPSSVTFTAGTDVGHSSGQNEDTITKNGVSMHCTSMHDTDTAYRYYSGSTLTFTSTIGNMAKIEFNMNGSYNSNLLSTTTGTYDHTSSSKGVWTGDHDSVAFSLSAQARVNSVVITFASTDPLVELDPSSATSVSMFKGDPDTSIKVLVKNIETKTWAFTFDEDEETGKTTSSYISVSAGAAVSYVHTLTITTKAAGSTVLHIAVSGTVCEATVPVTVKAKPASMTIVHSDIHEGELEIITGAHKQVSFSGLDTDGNPYSIAAADVTPSATSGASHVTLSGSRITGASEGTAVVRYTLNALTSVYAEITVNVVDDYIETVGEPTFATGLTDTQGQSPTVSVFTARPGTMHSGESTTIPFENYKFSYDQTYASAEYGSLFTYDFTHGTTVDSTHKLQTIYVFCDIDEAAHGSYTVTVEKFDDPLREIHLTNVTDHKATITRGDSLQLEWSYTPENPTDGKEVLFTVSENTENISITVNSTGLINVAASSNLGTAKVTIKSAHDASINDYVVVTASLESMTYIVDEEESLTPSTTVAVGDRVVMVAVDKNDINYEFTAFSGASTDYGVATSYTTSVSKSLILTVVAGNSTGTVAFKTSDNNYVAWVSGKNSITPKATLDDYGSWTINGSTFQNKQDTTRFMYLNYNNGTPRFACYADKSSDTKGDYTVPTFLKIAGGKTPHTVTETLFNAVHNNFGESGSGATYTWDAQCATFNISNWTSAGSNIKAIEGFANYKLNYAVSNASGNEIEQFLAKYDNVVAKFYKDCKTDQEKANLDFLGRVSSGKVVPDESRVSLIGITTNNGLAITIIIISSMISVAAIGGYFFIRRRKHN